MMIERIGGVTPLTNIQNARHNDDVSGIDSGYDTISISQEAKEKAQSLYLQQLANETPDIREDLVASLKEKINDPNYINDQILGSAADKIMDAFGI